MASSQPTRSSIATRVETANAQAEPKHLFVVAAFIFLTIVTANGLGYVIVEYGIMGGDTEWNYDQGSGETMVQTLARFCGGPEECWTMNSALSSPTVDLNDFQYLVYAGFVIYVTVEFAGLGSELLVWLLYLKHGWDEETEGRWRVAQFVFPLLGITSIGLAQTHNFLALIFLVIFLWKSGFPETILRVYSFLYNKEESKVQRLVDGLNGIGTSVHHSAGAMYVAMILVQVLPSNRYTLDVTLPLVMQHWFVLLKYVNKWAYAAVMLVLEAWFEWMVFSYIEIMHRYHWTGGLIGSTMIFAHWMYLLAAGIHMFCVSKPVDEMQMLQQIRRSSLYRRESFGPLPESVEAYKKASQMQIPSTLLETSFGTSQMTIPPTLLETSFGEDDDASSNNSEADKTGSLMSIPPALFENDVTEDVTVSGNISETSNNASVHFAEYDDDASSDTSLIA